MTFQVIDADRFVAAIFTSRKEAEDYIADTIREAAEWNPLIRVWMEIRVVDDGMPMVDIGQPIG